MAAFDSSRTLHLKGQDHIAFTRREALEMPCSYLPEIIIINILHRLPVKTLLRCTSVCKSWYFLITSPQFVSSHLKFTAASTENAPFLLLRRSVRNSESYDLYLDDQSLARLCTLEFPFRSTNSYFTIVGSCNGLLCLSDDRVYYMHTIILWNPSIKKSVPLPKPNLIYNSYGTFIQCLGFGFDSVACDYKVVRITYVDCGQSQPRVELYRLSTGTWQDMSYLGFEYFVHNRSCQTFINGATHWVASYMDCYDLIVLFDMCDEVFREMRLPASLVSNDPMRSKDLVSYMETLAIISWNASVAEPGFCVWVMKEYGVEESWTKHLSFDFHDFGGGLVRPLWVRRSGGVVAVWQDGHLICCEPDGAEIKDLGVKGSRSEDYRRSIHVDSFVESLVLLDRGSYLFDPASCNDLPALLMDDCNSVGSSGSDREQSSEGEYKHSRGS